MEHERPSSPRRLRLVEPTTDMGDTTASVNANYWDVVPPDGPWVFVADTALMDSGRIKGCWVDLRADEAELGAILSRVFNAPQELVGWVVIDQIGLGRSLLPEQVSIRELLDIAKSRGGQPQ